MTGSRLRVLALIDGYRTTGPARQLLAAAQGCSSVQITLALFQRSAAPTPLAVTARRSGIPTVVVRDRFPGDPRTALALARLIAEPGTDIVQTHGYKANVYARLIAPRMRRPWVSFLHGETWENLKVRAYFALERLAVRAADRVVVVSHEMARRTAARGVPASKIRVIHNACLVNGSDGEDAGAGRPERPPVIGVVGRLSPEKGVDIALRVLQCVLNRRREARMWVIGEGPEDTNLRSIAHKLGVHESVDWLGYQEDPGRLYHRMAVLLIPSRSEGLPNVALEAMASGVPVVASAVGGVPEVVADGRTGFLAAAEDAEGLGRGVIRLLEDASLRERLGRQAQGEVRHRFSLEARIKALLRVYEEVVDGNRAHDATDLDPRCADTRVG